MFRLKSKDPDDKEKLDPLWHFEDDILYFKGRVYVPKQMRKKVLEISHDEPLVGYMGRERTRDLLTREFYWPGMSKDCENYVRICQICKVNKLQRHAEHGLM